MGLLQGDAYQWLDDVLIFIFVFKYQDLEISYNINNL